MWEIKVENKISSKTKIWQDSKIEWAKTDDNNYSEIKITGRPEEHWKQNSKAVLGVRLVNK